MEKKEIIIITILLISLIACIAIISDIIYNSSEIPLIEESQEETQYTIGLPQKPDNFEMVLREMERGRIDIYDLGEEYILQPEFYAESWKIGKQKYDNHDYTRWGVYGNGAYPGNFEITLKNPSVETWIEICTSYRNGWAIETYQGVKLESNDSQYFDIKITPDQFLFSPTFPKITDDWVKKVNINISVKEVPPPGIYTIYINTARVSEEQNDKWFWEIFELEATDEQIQMLKECYDQNKDETIPNSDCEKLIEVLRRNVYVDTSNFQTSSRVIIKITVIDVSE